MTTSDQGVALIKDAEGFRPTLYMDEGHPCIGYGCDLTLDEATEFQGKDITEEEADALLRSRLPPIEGALNAGVKVALNQNQFDALVDFCYNEGIGHFQTSLLLKKLNMGDYTGASQELMRWVYAGGEVLSALKARRERERELFLSPV